MHYKFMQVMQPTVTHAYIWPCDSSFSIKKEKKNDKNKKTKKQQQYSQVQPGDLDKSLKEITSNCAVTLYD